jgi:hypothetical protein
MAHTRIRRFNTEATCPERKLDNELAQAVVAAIYRTMGEYIRGMRPVWWWHWHGRNGWSKLTPRPSYPD